jgi:tRNA A-37 threonylcarbamoyl transferase component Bud32
MNTNEGLAAMIGEEVEKVVVDPSLEGKTLGKYRIGSQVGGGGMGTVYLAEETNTGRTVVVKVVKFPSQEAAHRKMMIERFRREAMAACKVMHPNVAVTFNFDEIDGRLLLVMERIVGRTLRDEVVTMTGKPRAMPQRKAIEVAIGILKGLGAVHDAKIVHRDMKPSNVMLTDNGDEVKILDFGLGKPTEPVGNVAFDATLTQANTPLGSPLYMSPEQTMSLPVTESTDIYSVGVILFQMLTGHAPFRGRDSVEIFEKHRKASVPPIVSPLGPVHPGFDAVVRKAMAKDPGNRYASAAAMRAAIEAIEADLRPKAKSTVLPWIAGTMAFCAAAALAVGLMLTSGKASVPERGPEAVIKTARADVQAPSKAVAEAKAPGGFEIPPPPPPAASVAQGCELYTTGRTQDAIATLMLALADKPDDADGLYCLCGSYVRQPESHAEASKTCEAYLARPHKDATKAKQVDLWLRRIRR